MSDGQAANSSHPALPDSGLLTLLNGSTLRITVKDLEQMRDSLQAYLHANKDELATQGVYQSFLDELGRAGLFFTGQGKGHVGAWTVSVYQGEPMLIRREIPKEKITTDWYAALLKTESGWQVERLFPVRMHWK